MSKVHIADIQELVKSGDIVLSEYRSQLTGTFSDAQLIEAIAVAEEEDPDIEAVAAYLKTTLVNSTALVNSNSMTAYQLVDAIEAKIDAAFTDFVDGYLDDKEASKVGALPTAIMAMVKFDTELAQFPLVNSAPTAKVKHRGPIVTNGSECDWYPVNTTRIGGKKTKQGWRSHSQDLAERSPAGQGIKTQLDAIAEYKATKRVGPPQGMFKDKGDSEVMAIENHYKPRAAAHLTLWRQAIGIFQQLGKLAVCKNIAVRIYTTPVKPPKAFLMPDYPDAPWVAGEYLMPTTQPFELLKVQRTSKGVVMSDGRSVSITELLAWDISKAGNENATTDSLVDSISKEPATPELEATIKNVEQFEEYLDECYVSLSDPGFMAKILVAVKRESGKDLLWNLAMMRRELDALFSNKKDLRDAAANVIAERQESKAIAAQPMVNAA